MIGLSTKSTRRRNSRAALGSCVRRSLALLLICSAWSLSVAAQSGRVRERKAPPTPPPTTQPSSPDPKTGLPPPPEAPVPPGGELIKQKNMGAITGFELKNGLTLVVRENPAVPLATVLVRVESALGAEQSDSPDIALLVANLLAHNGETDARRIGASIDVEVDRTSTTFTLVAPSDSVSEAVEILSAAVSSHPFTDEQVQAEVAILAQSSDSDDLFSPGRRALAGFSSSETPGGVAGSQVAAFHTRWYQPDHTTVVVTGNVIPYTVMTKVQRAFGDFGVASQPDTPEQSASKSTGKNVASGAHGSRQQASESAVPAPPAPDPVASSPTYRSVRSTADISAITIAVPVPGIRSVDAPVSAVLATALAGGRGSRLGRTLVATGQVAEVDVDSMSSLFDGWLVIRIVVDPQHLDTAEATVFREIDRLRRERLSDAELQRARNLFEKRYYDRLSTVDGMARVLAVFQTRLADPTFGPKLVDRMLAVTAADVQRVAASNMAIERAEVHEVLPLGAPPRTFTSATYSETIAAWAPGLKKPVLATDVRSQEALPAVPEGRERRRGSETDDAVLLPVPQPVKDFSTLNGPQAFVREDQSRPLLSIGFFYPGGRDIESPGEAGVTELMLRSLARGPRSQSERFLFALEQLGCEVRIVNEPDFFGVVFETLSRNADFVMPLAIEAMENPRFDKAEVAAERDRLLQSQSQARSDRLDQAFALYYNGRFAPHPYGLSGLGTAESVPRLTDESVKDWYSRNVRAQFPLIGISGDTDGSSLVSRYVVDEIKRGKTEGPTVSALPQLNGASERIEPVSGTRTWQAIGFLGPIGGAPGLDALDVFVEAVAGPGSPMVRDARRAGANAAAFVERRRMCSAAVVQIEGGARDETRVRAAALGEFAKALSNTPSSVDLDAGRALAITRQARYVQQHTHRTLAYVRSAAFRMPLASVDSYAERIRAVTPEAVKKIAADVFSNPWSGRGIVRGSAGTEQQVPGE